MEDPPDAPRDLDVVQRWFQAVITHPEGVEEGIPAAKGMIELTRDGLESVVRRSRSLSAEERIAVYANAYYARLIECMAESYPTLLRAIGEEAFNGFVVDYLQHHPSRSYTLAHLDKSFVEYLRATRPDRPADGGEPEVGFPDFLIDLASLERAIAEVFDGPGIEKLPPLDPEILRSIPAEEFGAARLVPAPCLRLLHFRYPVNRWFTRVKGAAPDEEVDLPGPGPEWLALTRRDYVVRRISLTREQYELLLALHEGRSVAEAIEAAADHSAMEDDDLARCLGQWFEEWTRGGLFQGIER